MSLTAQEIFTTTIPERIKTNASAVAALDAIYEFNVAGAGTWTVDFTQGGAVREGASGESGCTINVTEKDLSDIVEGKLSAQMAFMTGKLKIDGNISLALKLGAIL